MTGLHHKFNVSRTDGRDLPGGDREHTRYFVLDPENDSDARQALGEYAYRCRYRNQQLSDEIYEWLETLDD